MERINKIISTAIEKSEDSKFILGFIEGAKWADNHPANVWHDASEIPQEECPIVCINECNKLYVGNIHLGNEPNDYWYGKPTVWNDNHLQTQWCFVQKWAYISDLLM